MFGEWPFGVVIQGENILNQRLDMRKTQSQSGLVGKDLGRKRNRKAGRPSEFIGRPCRKQLKRNVVLSQVSSLSFILLSLPVFFHTFRCNTKGLGTFAPGLQTN